MCISFEASIVAFLLGTFSGYMLTTKTIERRMIGFFVLFYSLIQLLEACIYYTNDGNPIFSQLIIINLGLQCLVFFYVLSYIFEIKKIYMIIAICIAIFTFISSFDKREITINKCIVWDLQKNYVNHVLTLMYATMFWWYLFDSKITKQNIDINFIKNSGLFLGLTLVYSYLVSRSCYSPGLWCLSSAILAPLFLLL